MAVVFTGCDSPDRTLETIRKDTVAYKTAPTPENELKVQQGFDKLDAQIADLRAKGKTAEAATIASSAANLRSDFKAAQMVNSLRDAQSAIEGIGQAIKDAGRSIGDVFTDGQPTPAPVPAR